MKKIKFKKLTLNVEKISELETAKTMGGFTNGNNSCYVWGCPATLFTVCASAPKRCD